MLAFFFREKVEASPDLTFMTSFYLCLEKDQSIVVETLARFSAYFITGTDTHYRSRNSQLRSPRFTSQACDILYWMRWLTTLIADSLVQQ